MSTDTRSTTQFGRVLHALDDAIVEFEIVDGEPIIIRANHAFRDIFSPDMKRVVGLPLNELIVPASRQSEAEQFDRRTTAGQTNVAFVERTTTEGEKTFLYRGIPIAGDRGFAIYTDVTGELQRQQDLEEIVELATELSDSSEETAIEASADRIKELAAGLLQFTDHVDGPVDAE